MDQSLSLLGRRWRLRGPETMPDTLAPLPFPEAFKALLVRRGVATPAEVEAFLDPSLERLSDPFALPGVARAVERIARAVAAGETIWIYGDYDVDGQTATALLVRVLRALGARVRAYIPNRMAEGYGLSIAALERLAAQGCTLVVTVDCGITAHREAAWAAERGVDLVITDHHEPPALLPKACAVVNPKLAAATDAGAAGSLWALAGCGVAFKLAEALGVALGQGKGPARNLLDLVALGTVADVVPLVGENRVLVHAGLARLNSTAALPGLRALCDVAGVSGAVRAGHLGFTLGPRLNAAGRIGDAGLGLELLLADSYDAALPIAERLDRENARRQAIEARVVEEALAQVEAEGLARERGLVVYKEGWHIGVVGIAAARLVEAYHRPAVILSVEGERARGSGRSIPGFDLYGALETCRDLFESFGGHELAAGMTLRTEDLPVFRRRFAAVARERLSEEDLVPSLDIDAFVAPEELTLAWVDALARLEPFGLGNPTPVFACRGMQVRAGAVGKQGEHLKCRLVPEAGGAWLDGIGFGLAGELLPKLVEGALYDVAFTPEVNEWNGTRRVSLRVRDVRPAPESPAAALARHAASWWREAAAAREPEQPPEPAPAWNPALRTPPALPLRDCRGVPKAELLLDLVRRGRCGIVMPAAGETVWELARSLAGRHPGLRDALFPWSPALAERHGPALGAALAAPPWFAVAAAPVAHPEEESRDGEIWRQALGRLPEAPAVVLWDVPADPRPFLAQVRLVAACGGMPEVCLAFDAEDVERFHRRVREDYPAREQLERVYVALRGLAARGPATRAALAQALERAHPGLLSAAGLRRALAILAELGLVHVDGERLRLGETGRKVDLAWSVRYNECNLIRTGPLAGAGDLLRLQPGELLERMTAGAALLIQAAHGRSAS